jgi:hypothetical protein
MGWLQLKKIIIVKWLFGEKRWFNMLIFSKNCDLRFINIDCNESEVRSMIAFSSYQRRKWSPRIRNSKRNNCILVCTYQLSGKVVKFIYPSCKGILVKFWYAFLSPWGPSTVLVQCSEVFQYFKQGRKSYTERRKEIDIRLLKGTAVT